MKDILMEYGKAIITSVMAVVCIMMILNVAENNAFKTQVEKKQDLAIMVADANPPRIDPERFLTRGAVLDLHEEHYYRDDISAKLSNGDDISNHIGASGDITDDGRIDTSIPGTKIVKYQVFFDDITFTKTQLYFVRGAGESMNTYLVSGIALPEGQGQDGFAMQMIDGATITNWAYTDTSGKFTYEYVMDGNYLAFAKLPQGALMKPFTVNGSNIDIGEVEYLSNDTTYAISGRMVANDEIMTEQKVEIFDKNGNFVNSGETNNLGQFSIDYMKPGDYIFKIETEEDVFTRDFTVETQDVNFGDIILNGERAKFDIFGYTVGAFEKALSGVKIDIYDEEDQLFTTLYSADDGAFYLLDMIPGNYRFVFGFSEGTLEKTVIIKDSNIDLGKIAFGDLYTVDGKITDNNGALSNASVTISNPNTGESITTKTDGEGDFILTSIPASNQTYQLIIETDYTYHTMEVSVKDANVHLGTITLTEQYTAEGKVMYSDMAIANVGVELIKDGSVIMRVETNSEGVFIFKNVPAGDYTIRVVDPHYGRGELPFTMKNENMYVGVLTLQDAKFKIEYMLDPSKGEQWLSKDEPGYQDGPFEYDSKEETRLPLAKKEGYEFIGWSMSEDGDSPMLAIPQYTAGDLKLYPVFKALNIYITLDANGGTVDIDSITSNVDSPIGELPTPTREGFTFIGWFDKNEGGNQITEDSTFKETTTIYAQWKEDVQSS